MKDSLHIIRERLDRFLAEATQADFERLLVVADHEFYSKIRGQILTQPRELVDIKIEVTMAESMESSSFEFFDEMEFCHGEALNYDEELALAA